MENNTEKQLPALGAIPSPYDERDYIAKEHITMGVRPLEYYPKKYAPVKNQGQICSCAAHAASTLKWYQELDERQSNTEFSTDFIYHNRKDSDYQGTGMITRQTCANLCEFGVCTKGKLPTNTEYPNAGIKNMIAGLKPEALEYKNLKYVSCKTVEEVSEAIYQYKAIIVCLTVRSSFDSFYMKNSLDDAILPQPQTDERNRGGHAVCAIGYNNKGIIIQNSWGEYWGWKGKAIIPWDYSEIYEMWAIIDERKTWNIISLEIGEDIAYINGIESKLDAPARIVKNRTLVPIRFIAEALGAKVDWLQANQSINIKYDDITVQMQINSKLAFINSKPTSLDVAPTIYKNRTFIPLRFVAEALKADVEWIEDERKVVIRKEIK